MVDGSDRPGDQDLVIHFAMVRARGRALIGPQPGELFLEPVRDSLLEAFPATSSGPKEKERPHGTATTCPNSPRWRTKC